MSDYTDRDYIVVRSKTRRNVLNEADPAHPNGEVQVGGLNPHLVGETPEVLRLLQTGDLVRMYSAEAREAAIKQATILRDMGQGQRPVEEETEVAQYADAERKASRAARADERERADRLEELNEERGQPATDAEPVTAPRQAQRSRA